MTPEAEACLKKARACLEYADANIEVDLGNDAGRNAYLAVFHAARALIFERTGRVLKTHHGVHAEFNRIALQEREVKEELRRILPQNYNLKAVADYETGPQSLVPLDRASAATENAKRFVECMSRLLLRGGA